MATAAGKKRDEHDIVGRHFADMDLTVKIEADGITLGEEEEKIRWDEKTPKEMAAGLREIADWLDSIPESE